MHECKSAGAYFDCSHSSWMVIAPMVSYLAVASSKPKSSFSSIFNVLHWMALFAPSESILKKNGNSSSETYSSLRLGNANAMARSLALIFPSLLSLRRILSFPCQDPFLGHPICLVVGRTSPVWLEQGGICLYMLNYFLFSESQNGVILVPVLFMTPFPGAYFCPAFIIY